MVGGFAKEEEGKDCNLHFVVAFEGIVVELIEVVVGLDASYVEVVGAQLDLGACEEAIVAGNFPFEGETMGSESKDPSV